MKMDVELRCVLVEEQNLDSICERVGEIHSRIDAFFFVLSQMRIVGSFSCELC